MFNARNRGKIWLPVCGQAGRDRADESCIVYLSPVSMDVSCTDKDDAKSLVSKVFEL